MTLNGTVSGLRMASRTSLSIKAIPRRIPSIHHRLQTTVRSFSSTVTKDDSTSNSRAAKAAVVNLYQYKICPFSNIAKAVLTYQQVPFKAVEVNPLTKAELKFSKDYRKVPIVQQQDGSQWNGTEEILEHFAAAADSSSNSSTFANSPSSLKWTDFARNKLAPLLYPNLCSTLSNSFRAFEYVHQEPSFSTLQRYSIQYVGSLAMYFAASKIKKKYQLDDVRVALDDALLELEEGLQQESATTSTWSALDTTTTSSNANAKTHNVYLNNISGEGPHLGDLAVFGVLKGLEGLPILTEGILQDSRFPNIREWYHAMDQEVESKKLS